MLEKPQITHVLFDLDGLLINSEQIYTEQMIELFARHGKAFSYDVKRLVMGRKPLEAIEILRKQLDLNMTVEEATQEYQRAFSPEIFHKATLMPGVRKLVEHLHRNSIPMAIATGSEQSHLADKMWNDKDIWQLIHHVVASGDDPEVIAYFGVS